ncbi:MAG: TolC family protein [Spirochaetaceae bacterium]|jgi:outer membrane protein TolC|nr:TolC family protein [Spirochaetaceae bacterium]
MKKFWNAALMFFCAGVMFAQEAPDGSGSPQPVKSISLDEAVALAVQNNLGLQSGKVTLEKKKRPADLAWNQFLPAVGVSGTLSAANKVSETQVPVIGPGGISYSTVEGPRWGLSAGFQIQWQGLNFAMFEGIRQLKETYEAGGITYEKAKIQLERDVRKLYSSILFASENLKVQEASFALAEEQVRTATANFRAGLSPELTLMQARLNRDNLVPTLDQTRNNIKVSMANLAMLLGLPYDTDFTLISDDGLDFDIDLPFHTKELIRSAAGNKIDIQELRANIRSARTARNALRYQLLTPSLSLGWTLAPSFQGDPFKDEWNGDSWTDRGSFSLSLSWSLNGFFPFTTQAANLRDLEDDLRNMDINLANLIRAAEVEVYNTVFLIRQAQESVEAQLRTVELAQQTYDNTLRAFRAGLRDFIEVQNVEQQLRQARLGVLQQKLNFLTGVIDLEYAIGVPFGALSTKDGEKQ